jgi:formylglycine-generating enzyme required for sulfatase activity
MPVEDKEETRNVDDRLLRVLRGGSFFRHASYARSACRLGMVPTYRNDTFGFRLARTYP